MAALVVIVLLAGAGYLFSLRVHPLKRCPVCKGQSRHYGSVYTYAYRRCRTCGGTGRGYRLGAKVFLGHSDNTGGFGNQ